MDWDPVFLSRLQFAFTVGFHYLFPPLTIGLGLLMVIMEGMFLWTRNHEYESMAKFWTRIFALIFAVGVASGIVMEFQFGTNWSTYARYVGDIFGSALAAEGIFAFFLESGFLAVLVFGWDRVSPAMHFFATVMVSLGSIFSAIWIIVANSWQQTPAGYHIVEAAGRAEITDFWAVVFNPSTVDRLLHVLIAACISAGFFVMSVSAFYLLRNRHVWFAKRTIRIALPFTTVFSLLILWSGHSNARMVGAHQPTKLAAFEGQFRTQANAPMYLFGIPDAEAQRVKYGVPLPGMLSLLLHGRTDAVVLGLADPAAVPVEIGPEEDIRSYWPPLGLTFQAYHAMVALGMLFIAISLVSLGFWLAGRLYRQRWLLRVLVFAVVGPILANQLGWIAAEVGRQPWIVWGLLKTQDAASQVVPAGQIVASMAMFGVIYLLLFLVWLTVMDHKIKAGPDDPEALAHEARRRGWFAAATARAAPGGASMTEAHDDIDGEA